MSARIQLRALRAGAVVVYSSVGHVGGSVWNRLGQVAGSTWMTILPACPAPIPLSK